MKFEYRGPGASQDVSAEVAGVELTRIAARDGGIAPRVVVEESRPESAPLHAAFEWNDGIAAEEYRQEQARRLVRAVVLVPEPERNESTPVFRAFVSLRNPDGASIQSRHYKPLLDVLANPLEAEELKRRLRNEVLAMRERYSSLMELDEAINGAIHSLEAAVA